MDVTYLMTSLFLLILLVIMSVNGDTKLRDNTDRTIMRVVACLTAVYIALDGISEFLRKYDVFYKSALSSVTYLTFLAYLTLPYCWYKLSNKCIFGDVKYRVAEMLSSIPWAFNVILTVASMFRENVLWTIGSADNRFSHGSMFGIYTLINLAYYIVPIIQILVVFVTRPGRMTKKRIHTLQFTAIPAFGIFLQWYIIGTEVTTPIRPFAFTLGVLFAYAVMMDEVGKDAEKRHHETEAELHRALAFTDAFMYSYVSAYYVNLRDHSQIVFHRNAYLQKEYGDYQDFRKSITAYINKDVYEADRATMLEATDLDYIMERLKRENRYSVYMRDISQQNMRWFRMDIVRGADSDHAAIAFTDATDVVTRETERARTLSVFNRLSENFEYICYIDTQSKIVSIFHMSDKIKNIIGRFDAGLRSNLLLDRFLNEFVIPEDHKQFIEDVSSDRIMHELEKRKHVDVIARGSVDGQVSYYQFRFAMDSDSSIGVILGIRDVTNEVTRTRELEEARNAADVANKAKSAFLFNMSHDIRTPMNAIIGFTKMARKYMDDKEKVSDFLNKIDVSGQQLLSLINQVLEMSRIEAGKIEIVEEAVDITERFESLLTVVEPQAVQHGLKFVHELRGIKHRYVYVDPTRMTQIALNVVSNAIKYTPEGGTIRYIMEEKPGVRAGFIDYVLTVEDNGIGMSKEFLEHIFEPFARENTSTVSNIQGTGLGMSILKEIVDLMRGSIHVESEKGEGTRFEITIPLRIANERNVRVEHRSRMSHEPIDGKRVLLVEDNELNREIATDILDEIGLSVEQANDGDVAVECIKKHIAEGDAAHFDFILMDVQMPRMNGYEATREIRCITEPLGIHIPIIAMTANAFDEDRKRAIEAGMDHHLSKPIRVEELLETLATCHSE